MSFPLFSGSKQKQSPVPDPFAEVDLKTTTGTANPFKTPISNPFATPVNQPSAPQPKNPFEMPANNPISQVNAPPPKPPRKAPPLPQDLFAPPEKAKSLHFKSESTVDGPQSLTGSKSVPSNPFDTAAKSSIPHIPVHDPKTEPEPHVSDYQHVNSTNPFEELASPPLSEHIETAILEPTHDEMSSHPVQVEPPEVYNQINSFTENTLDNQPDDAANITLSAPDNEASHSLSTPSNPNFQNDHIEANTDIAFQQESEIMNAPKFDSFEPSVAFVSFENTSKPHESFESFQSPAQTYRFDEAFPPKPTLKFSFEEFNSPETNVELDLNNTTITTASHDTVLDSEQSTLQLNEVSLERFNSDATDASMPDFAPPPLENPLNESTVSYIEDGDEQNHIYGSISDDVPVNMPEIYEEITDVQTPKDYEPIVATASKLEKYDLPNESQLVSEPQSEESLDISEPRIRDLSDADDFANSFYRNDPKIVNRLSADPSSQVYPAAELEHSDGNKGFVQSFLSLPVQPIVEEAANPTNDEDVPQPVLRDLSDISEFESTFFKHALPPPIPPPISEPEPIPLSHQNFESFDVPIESFSMPSFDPNAFVIPDFQPTVQSFDGFSPTVPSSSFASTTFDNSFASYQPKPFSTFDSFEPTAQPYINPSMPSQNFVPTTFSSSNWQSKDFNNDFTPSVPNVNSTLAVPAAAPLHPDLVLNQTKPIPSKDSSHPIKFDAFDDELSKPITSISYDGLYSGFNAAPAALVSSPVLKPVSPVLKPTSPVVKPISPALQAVSPAKPVADVLFDAFDLAKIPHPVKTNQPNQHSKPSKQIPQSMPIMSQGYSRQIPDIDNPSEPLTSEPINSVSQTIFQNPLPVHESAQLVQNKHSISDQSGIQVQNTFVSSTDGSKQPTSIPSGFDLFQPTSITKTTSSPPQNLVPTAFDSFSLPPVANHATAPGSISNTSGFSGFDSFEPVNVNFDQAFAKSENTNVHKSNGFDDFSPTKPSPSKIPSSHPIPTTNIKPQQTSSLDVFANSTTNQPNVPTQTTTSYLKSMQVSQPHVESNHDFDFEEPVNNIDFRNAPVSVKPLPHAKPLPSFPSGNLNPFAPPIAKTSQFDDFDEESHAAPTFTVPLPRVPAQPVPLKSPVQQTNASKPTLKPANPGQSMVSHPFASKSKPDVSSKPLSLTPASTVHQTVNLLDDDLDSFVSSPSNPANQTAVTAQTLSQKPADEEDVMVKFRKMYNISETNLHQQDIDDEDDDDFEISEPRHDAKAPVNQPKKPSRVSSVAIKDTSSLPSSGLIFARLTATSLFTKEWTRYFWCLENDFLYIFSDTYTSSPGHLSTKQAKKIIPIAHNLRLLKVHPKDYKGYGIMFNFMMEEIFDYGPASVAKFASPSKDQITEFWEKIQAAIKHKRKEALEMQAILHPK